MKTDYTRQDIIPNIFFVILTLVVVSLFLNQLFVEGYYQTWNVSEWLINYQGGFVRRGLRGELIFQLFNRFDIDPFTAIRAITGLSWIALLVFFVIKFINKGYPILLIPSILILGNPIYNKFWLRADCIVCLLFIAIVYMIHKKPFLYILWINLFTIIGLLIHEIFIFIFIPITVLLLFNELKSKSTSSTIFRMGLLLLPSILCFFLVFIFNGSEELVSKVWQSWGDNPFLFDFNKSIDPESPYPGALDAITYNLRRGLQMAAEPLYSFTNGIYAPFMVITMIIAIYHVLVNINKLDFKILKFKPKNDHNESLISTVFYFQFIVTMPLYVLGYDYGRWIFYWVISSFILILILPKNQILASVPSFITKQSSLATNTLRSVLGYSKSTIFIISSMIWFSTTFWYFEDLNRSSFHIVASFISSRMEKFISVFMQ